MERALAARIALFIGIAGIVVAVAVTAGLGGVEPGAGADPELREDVTYVTVTFDDGYESNVDAADALEARGMRGVFYISAGVLGGTFEGIPTMQGVQVRELEERGHEIGGHTYSHANLSALNGSGVRQEIEQNRAALDDIGVEPVSFAYPYGAGTEHADTVGEYYSYARTVQWDTNDLPPADPLRMHTVAVTEDSHDTFQERLSRVDGGEWLVIAIHDVAEDVEREHVDISRETYEQVLNGLDREDIEVVTFQDMENMQGQGGEG